MKKVILAWLIASLTALGSMLSLNSAALANSAMSTMDMTEQQMEDLVRQSYRFVAMYNVNNKMVMDSNNPMSTDGWNKIRSNTSLLDHTMKAIARPNNDTLYINASIDVTKEPVILDIPAFDSIYVSLMVTGYDHYVNIPLSTQNGDFDEPTKILFYSERTPDYSGEPVEGVEHIFEATGDYLSAVFRVMPHANEPERMERNLAAMKDVKVVPLSEYLDKEKPQAKKVAFPDFGVSDFDIFENNLLEVMQFVFNHTTFDPNEPVDKAVLATYEPLGVVPGREYDPNNVAQIDGKRVREVAEHFAQQQLARAAEPDFQPNMMKLFKLKGEISEELLAFQSVLGPIGQPAVEAVYPPIPTADGRPMTATHDYIIKMTAAEMPPAKAFWSITLYDTDNGFFIPNEQKKYSVGLNGGMELDEDGGITIAIAAEKPEGIAEDNWLPIERSDIGIGPIMRIYAPDLEKLQNWKPPVAEQVN